MIKSCLLRLVARIDNVCQTNRGHGLIACNLRGQGKGHRLNLLRFQDFFALKLVLIVAPAILHELLVSLFLHLSNVYALSRFAIN